MDFVGINVYRPSMYVLASDQAPGYRAGPVQRVAPEDVSRPGTRSGPEVMYWAPRFVQSTLEGTRKSTSPRTVAPRTTAWPPTATCYDTDRVMFLRNSLNQLQRATADGVPVKGYFLLEPDGQLRVERRATAIASGIVYVDFRTQKRTPKMSAAFFREVSGAQRGDVRRPRGIAMSDHDERSILRVRRWHGLRQEDV